MFKIDTKDLEIIKIMNENSRIPLSAIATKLKLSLNAVKNRIIAMEEEGVIRGYTCDLIPGILGEETALAKITISKEVESIKALADVIGSHELVFLVGVGLGNQLVVVFTYRSSSDVMNLESYIKTLTFVNTVEIFLLLGPPRQKLPQIAPVDYMLISKLRQNGRMSFHELAKKTQISTRTLKKRIDKLIRERIITFPLILSPGSSEDLINFTIFCMLKPNANKIEFFQKTMNKFPNTWVGWIVVDKPMIIVIFFADSLKNIRKTEESIKQDPLIVSTETITGGEGFYYPDWRTTHVDELGKEYLGKN
ncbi:MAG: winged helix-turn-helix transcriptional regulator [Candidatus Hermodarchaeota archaeon]